MLEEFRLYHSGAVKRRQRRTWKAVKRAEDTVCCLYGNDSQARLFTLFFYIYLVSGFLDTQFPFHGGSIPSIDSRQDGGRLPKHTVMSGLYFGRVMSLYVWVDIGNW